MHWVTSARQTWTGPFIKFIFIFWSLSQWGNLLVSCQDTEQLYVWLKIQNLMIWVPSVKNIVHGWHKVINIFMNEIIVSSNVDSWKTWYYCFLINANVLKLFSFSCLKRENANHLTINCRNTKKCVVFLCLLVFFFFAYIFLKKKIAQGKKS